MFVKRCVLAVSLKIPLSPFGDKGIFQWDSKGIMIPPPLILTYGIL